MKLERQKMRLDELYLEERSDDGGRAMVMMFVLVARPRHRHSSRLAVKGVVRAANTLPPGDQLAAAPLPPSRLARSCGLRRWSTSGRSGAA